ncbi:uncharacterized protein LOC107653234 [Sinocyclocheilus anshuiensis]|uniref:uncharacterized protein LOC107653234 n=1 Tax=Sinocyclocheilus anshuiensis TaxID=1608454 RepID=UPI0007B9CEB4|nr:PREDICTED: uncharacterized protein LOC107653234 [Sinocyclocheilus anshuiensis]
MSKRRGKLVNKDREGTLSLSASITLAEITALHDDIRASFAVEFKASFESFAAKLDSIQSTVADHDLCIGNLESETTDISQHLEQLEATCSALQKDNVWLKAKVSDLESRSRRPKYLKSGLTQVNRTAFFSQLLVDVLGSHVLSSPPELDRAHRSLAPKPAAGQRARPVILRFHRFQVKDLVIRESRKKGELLYDGTKIHIFEDYCPEVLKLRAEYTL